MYLYPDNLTARPMLWLWALRDVALIGIALLSEAEILATDSKESYQDNGFTVRRANRQELRGLKGGK